MEGGGRVVRAGPKSGPLPVLPLKAFVFKGSPLTAADLGSYLNFAGKNIDVFKSDSPLKFRYSEKALKI